MLRRWQPLQQAPRTLGGDCSALGVCGSDHCPHRASLWGSQGTELVRSWDSDPCAPSVASTTPSTVPGEAEVSVD